MRNPYPCNGALLSFSAWSWPEGCGGGWDGGVGGRLSPSPLVPSPGCFSLSVYATQKQLVRKKSLGVNCVPLIIFPRLEHGASIISMFAKKWLCLCALAEEQLEFMESFHMLSLPKMPQSCSASYRFSHLLVDSNGTFSYFNLFTLSAAKIHATRMKRVSENTVDIR